MLVLRHFQKKIRRNRERGEQEAETGVGSCYVL